MTGAAAFSGSQIELAKAPLPFYSLLRHFDVATHLAGEPTGPTFSGSPAADAENTKYNQPPRRTPTTSRTDTPSRLTIESAGQLSFVRGRSNHGLGPKRHKTRFVRNVGQNVTPSSVLAGSRVRLYGGGTVTL